VQVTYRHTHIWVIYGGIPRGDEGYCTPTFRTRGTVHPYPTFLDEKVKNLLLSAVNIGDLRILNYNKTIFGRGSAPPWTPQRELMTLSQTPESDVRDTEHSPPLSSWDPRAPRAPSELVPPLTKVTPLQTHTQMSSNNDQSRYAVWECDVTN